MQKTQKEETLFEALIKGLKKREAEATVGVG